MDAFRYYDFKLAANATQVLLVTGKNFRVQSQTGAVDVTVDSVGTLPGLLTGQGLKDVPFTRLTVKDVSGAPNVGMILVAPEEFVDNRTYGVSTIAGGSLDLTAATLLTQRTPLQANGNYKSVTNLAANTPDTVFTPAANVNGAIVLTAQMTTGNGGAAPVGALLAKSSAPASVIDGEAVLYTESRGNYFGTGNVLVPQYVAAGQGLYFITSVAETYCSRACRYRLL